MIDPHSQYRSFFFYFPPVSFSSLNKIKSWLLITLWLIRSFQIGYICWTVPRPPWQRVQLVMFALGTGSTLSSSSVIYCRARNVVHSYGTQTLKTPLGVCPQWVPKLGWGPDNTESPPPLSLYIPVSRLYVSWWIITPHTLFTRSCSSLALAATFRVPHSGALAHIVPLHC